MGIFRRPPKHPETPRRAWLSAFADLVKTLLFNGLLRGVSAVFSTPAECVQMPAARASGLRRRGAESYQKGARVSGVRVCRVALGAAVGAGLREGVRFGCQGVKYG